MIEPSCGRNLKSKVFSSWATCYMRQCVDNTVVGNDLRLENRKGNNLICYGRNLKSKVFSSWATCYMRQCVDNTVVGNDLRLENRKGNNLICLFWLQR